MAASADLLWPASVPAPALATPPDAWTTAFQPDPAWVAARLARLAPLLPDPLSRAAAPDLCASALDFVARYGRDIPQLEHEWELLYAAQLLAVRRGAHGAVVRLAVALARVVGRLRAHTAAARMLQLGIGASRRIQDRRHLALLLNRLGGLFCAYGAFDRGARLWYTSLRLAETWALGLWEPLSAFAVAADLVRGDAATERFVAGLQVPCRTARSVHGADALAVALFVRGFHARTNGALDRAGNDFAACLGLLARSRSRATPDRQLFMFAARAELARAQGDYTRSHSYTATALALARLYGDDYTRAALLVDQIYAAQEHGQRSDARTALEELRATLALMGAPAFYERTRLYLERTVESATGPASPNPLALPAGALTPAPPALSPREREVLRLVAAGLSNQEAAARLVVTTGTIKKHLEHIYTKLDTSSRTAAVARARDHHLI